MTKIKVMLLLVVSCSVLLGCPNNSLPKKSNVLNRPSDTGQKQQSNQTVFTTSKADTKSEMDRTETSVIKNARVKDKTSNINSSNLTYGSSPYYQYKADSLQAAYSKEDYTKNIQLIVDQISATPNEKTNPAINTDEWYAAIDFDIRKPNFIILHHTGQSSAAQTLHTFSLRRPGRESSAHYVVGRDGKVYQMLNDYVR